MIDVVKSKNSLDRSQKLKNWFDMKKLWIMCLSLFAIVLSSGASHAGLSLDRCSPFFAVSYHENIDTDFNETHPGVKYDWNENKTISVIRNYVYIEQPHDDLWRAYWLSGRLHYRYGNISIRITRILEAGTGTVQYPKLYI